MFRRILSVVVLLAVVVAAVSPVSAACDPYTQGFWARQCRGLGLIQGGNGKGPGPHPAFPLSYIQAVIAAADGLLQPFTGQTACEALDPEPASDVCERALSQCGAMVLNLVDGDLETSCPVDLSKVELPAGFPVPTTVGEALLALQLLQMPPTPDDCRIAHDICAAINE